MSHHEIFITPQRIELRNSVSELPSGLSLRDRLIPRVAFRGSLGTRVAFRDGLRPRVAFRDSLSPGVII